MSSHGMQLFLQLLIDCVVFRKWNQATNGREDLCSITDVIMTIVLLDWSPKMDGLNEGQSDKIIIVLIIVNDELFISTKLSKTEAWNIKCNLNCSTSIMFAVCRNCRSVVIGCLQHVVN